MRTLFSTCALVLLTLSLNTFAQEPYRFSGTRYSITHQDKGSFQEISLRGVILSGFVEDLDGLKAVQKKLIPDLPIRLVLHSGGGFQMRFNQLARSLRKACPKERCEITTVVESMCASACIPLFMVGDVREASRYASFGFHQAAVVPGAVMIPRMAQRDLRRAGVDETWLQENDSMFQSLDITWRRPRQLHGSNIVTREIE